MEKTTENQNNQAQSRAVAENAAQLKVGSGLLNFVDNRSETAAQRKMIDMMRNAPQAKQMAQMKAAPVQLKENKTGMPDNLKSGLENLSGMSMDHVKVHYNSPEPAQLNAHAFTQGSDIHVASGQEKHLAHEGWHVAQQAQGRVQPTMQMAGTQINDDAGLEKEADVMGGKALNTRQKKSISPYDSKSRFTTSDSLLQLKPDVPIEVTGITHLIEVAGKSKSIFKGSNYLEVSKSKTGIIIDAGDKLRSRRGPNQELHHDMDAQKEHIYRWFRVIKIGDTVIDEKVFIRDETFNLMSDSVDTLGDRPAELGGEDYRHRGEGLEAYVPLDKRDNYFDWLKETRVSHLPVHLTGEVNSSGNAVGGHIQEILAGGNVEITNPTLTTFWAPDDIQKAKIKIRNPGELEFVQKKPFSTFFPRSWSMERVLQETSRILSDPKNKEHERGYRGISSDGNIEFKVRLTGKIGNLKLDTVFPLPKK